MITMQIKTLFFDKQTVLRAVDKAKRAVLSKAGAFIRTTAKHSIRTKKGSAPAGQPPHSHEGSLRRLIYFGYDPGSASVVIGPLGFRKSTAPNVLEFGGKTEVRRRRRGKIVKTRAIIQEHPYMGPALQKERPNLPKRWAGSVRG
ncbi:MAG: hypothetical protein KBH81_01275 [Phycisphaerae bacterium]|nr:hypothetical protein [Phycisphaerae bacterium]